MRNLRFLFLILVGTLLARAGAAQTDAGTVPEARVVIERFGSVTKLAEKLAQASSRRERVTVKFAGIEGKIESCSTKPDRHRESLDLGGMGKMVSGCDGEVAWISGDLTGSRLLTGMDGYQARLESSWDSPLKPAGAYESMRTLGLETFEGKPCWKLEFVAKPLAGLDPEKSRAARTSHEYYEVASGFLIGVQGTMDGDFGSGPTKTIYSDYKDFGGVTLAAKRVSSAQGVEMVYQTEAHEFDTVTEADLALPLEIQRMIEANAAKAAPATPKAQ